MQCKKEKKSVDALSGVKNQISVNTSALCLRKIKSFLYTTFFFAFFAREVTVSVLLLWYSDSVGK